MDRLGEAWVDAAAFLGAAPDATAVSAADLLTRYAQAHRHYHTADHVEAVLRDCLWLGDELRLDRGEQSVVALAACAHDVVYDARPGDDERASAAWARTHLAAAEVDDVHIAEVERLVLTTLTHEPRDDDDRAAIVLLDADLAVLGSVSPAYSRYAAAVRLEYSQVSDDDWRTGRGQVLRGLLAKPNLYRSEAARRRWDSNARHNMERELAALN